MALLPQTQAKLPTSVTILSSLSSFFRLFTGTSMLWKHDSS